MSTLFYIITFFLFLFRLPLVYKWKSIFDRSIYINKWKGVTKRDYKFSPENDVPITIAALLMGSTFLWSIIGLMSDNWFLFSLILVLSFLISIFHSLFGNIIKDYVKSKLKLTLSWLLIICNTGLLFLISINYFHLNLNFLELIKNYL